MGRRARESLNAGNELSLLAITRPERVVKLVYLDAAFYIDGQLELFKHMLQEAPEFFRGSFHLAASFG